jgi:hypothetical protein
MIGNTGGTTMRNRLLRSLILWMPVSLLAAADPVEEARKDIIAAYQRAMDALQRSDAEAALQIDTEDWVSITAGQKPRTRQELEPYIRRDIAGLKPPLGWLVTWKPDYQHNGTTSGIQLYELKLNGTSATVLCLLGSSRTEVIDGATHKVWTGSHVRDTWTKIEAGWKRRMHEKMTTNERMVDGRPSP